MSVHKSSLWCVVKECNKNVMEKRHFFCFQRNMTVMGPEYAHRNYRLCHLHFEEKWYKIDKNRAQLHPDTIPTIFFGKNSTPVTTALSLDDKNIIEEDQQEKINSDVQLSTILPMDTDATEVQIKPSTFTHLKIIKETPRKKKLKEQNFKVKAENRKLREKIRRLQKKVKTLEHTKKTDEDPKEHETLCQLDCICVCHARNHNSYKNK